jgi:heptaprenyl diphosphate synthase
MNELTIHQMATPFISHPTIQTFATLPSFPSFRIEWLRAIMAGNYVESSLNDNYVLAVSLLQFGLDTHDAVPAQHATEHVLDFRNLQLKVLAGDYFSSRYYQILAQIEDVEMIQILARAVCDVNQLKMKLYLDMQQSKITATSYLERVMEIRLPVFQCLTELRPDLQEESFQQTYRSVTMCEVLSNELQQLTSSSKGYLYWYLLERGTNEEKLRLLNQRSDIHWLEAMNVKYEIARHLYDELEYHSCMVEQSLSQHTSDPLTRVWQQFREPWQRVISTPNVLS